MCNSVCPGRYLATGYRGPREEFAFVIISWMWEWNLRSVDIFKPKCLWFCTNWVISFPKVNDGGWLTSLFVNVCCVIFAELNVMAHVFPKQCIISRSRWREDVASSELCVDLKQYSVISKEKNCAPLSRLNRLSKLAQVRVLILTLVGSQR